MIRYLFAGDLLGQSMASSFGLASYEIPYFGVYGACSTCGESLSLGAMTIGGGFATQVVCVTSSHFASAEKEFREHGMCHGTGGSGSDLAASAGF